VSAAVPANIDAVTCRALFQRGSRSGPPLTTPAMLAEALAEVAPRGPLPILDLPAVATRVVPSQPTGPTSPYPAADPAPGPRGPRGPRSGRAGRPPAGRRSPASKAVVSAVIALVLVAVGVLAWSVSRNLHHAAPAQTAPSHSPTPSAAAAVQLKPVSAESFGAGRDDSGEAQLAIDGSPATAWHTSFYIGDPVFGGLQKGTGLLLDMGKQVRLSQVVVQFGTSCCAHAQIAIANNPGAFPGKSTVLPDGFTVLQSSDQGHGSTTFSVTKSTTGRYVLIWLTSLPSNSSGNYQAFINNVSVRGSVVSQSG
jgi:hypothetical protein